jgi:hypothetical protein
VSIRLDKPFQTLNDDNVAKLSGNLGVFQLADDKDKIVYIGYAGGKSLFGLRGEVDACKHMQGASQFRVEVNMSYLTRYQELLMVYISDYDRVPLHNDEQQTRQLGKLSPG